MWIAYLNLVAQHDFLMKFCNHDCGGSSTGSKLEACKLVMVSPFIVHGMNETKICFGFVYSLTNYFWLGNTLRQFYLQGGIIVDINDAKILE